jgi:hypothetical protein
MSSSQSVDEPNSVSSSLEGSITGSSLKPTTEALHPVQNGASNYDQKVLFDATVSSKSLEKSFPIAAVDPLPEDRDGGNNGSHLLSSGDEDTKEGARKEIIFPVISVGSEGEKTTDLLDCETQRENGNPETSTVVEESLRKGNEETDVSETIGTEAPAATELEDIPGPVAIEVIVSEEGRIPDDAGTEVDLLDSTDLTVLNDLGAQVDAFHTELRYEKLITAEIPPASESIGREHVTLPDELVAEPLKPTSGLTDEEPVELNTTERQVVDKSSISEDSATPDEVGTCDHSVSSKSQAKRDYDSNDTSCTIHIDTVDQVDRANSVDEVGGNTPSDPNPPTSDSAETSEPELYRMTAAFDPSIVQLMYETAKARMAVSEGRWGDSESSSELTSLIPNAEVVPPSTLFSQEMEFLGSVETSGKFVKLSADGNRMFAVSSSSTEMVEVWEFEDGWHFRSRVVLPEKESEFLDLAINGNGTRVILSTKNYEQNGEESRFVPTVRVFGLPRRQHGVADWKLVGEAMDDFCLNLPATQFTGFRRGDNNTTNAEGWGATVDMSEDGSHIAVAAPGVSIHSRGRHAHNFVGAVQVFQHVDTITDESILVRYPNCTWIPKGNLLTGDFDDVRLAQATCCPIHQSTLTRTFTLTYLHSIISVNASF